MCGTTATAARHHKHCCNSMQQGHDRAEHLGAQAGAPICEGRSLGDDPVAAVAPTQAIRHHHLPPLQRRGASAGRRGHVLVIWGGVPPMRVAW
eukprot:264996-Chlamydomonas_euryale.AAC.4